MNIGARNSVTNEARNERKERYNANSEELKKMVLTVIRKRLCVLIVARNGRYERKSIYYRKQKNAYLYISI